MRVLVVAFFVVAAQAFLQFAPAVVQQRQHATALVVPHQPHRTTRRAKTLAHHQQGASGAGGLSATLPIDAVTRAEALNGFFAAVVLSTTTAAAVVADTSTEPSADRLGVVDDLLADCPSVRRGGGWYCRLLPGGRNADARGLFYRRHDVGGEDVRAMSQQAPRDFRMSTAKRVFPADRLLGACSPLDSRICE